MNDLETLRRQAQIQETYETQLQNSSVNLLELLKKAKQGIDSTKAQADVAEQTKEQAYLDAKAAVGELGSNLNQLQQQCQKLSTSLCPTKPQLICQMPLNDLKASRRAVESDLKFFIVKQFQKDAEKDSSNTNQHLHHLIESTDKKKLDQQCKDLEKLQAEHGKTMANKILLEAENNSLRAAIDFIKAKRTASEGDHASVAPPTKSIKELELEVKEAAARSAENTANAISHSNLIVKQTRLKYFLDRMTLVHQMLERQTAVDKLLLNFMSVESEITREANHFLLVVGDHFKKEVEQLALNLQALVEMKESANFNQQIGQNSIEDKHIQEFNTKCLRLLADLENHLQFLRKKSALLEQQHDSGNAQQDLQSIAVSVGQLEKLQAEFKAEIHSGTVDFMKTKERLKLCKDMKPPVDLWQVFLASPERLAEYLPQGPAKLKSN